MLRTTVTSLARRVAQRGIPRSNKFVVSETVLVESSLRLRHSCDSCPGIIRERVETGFRYRLPDGTLVRDQKILSRIRLLVILPAWEKVWICRNANGHLQATGRDARGRKQYRYHPAFRSSRETEKFGHLAQFGHALPRIRERFEADLLLPGLPREKVLAAVVKLLDQTHLRVGNIEYAKTNHSFGLSTLQDRHVTFMRDAFRLRFRGKSGVWHDRTISDRKLMRIIRDCQHLPGQDLFQYRDASHSLRRIGSADVNAYIQDAARGSFTAKDFRTWAGTVSALARLAQFPEPATQATAKRAIVQVIGEVATELGNTRAVCRKSYIHPRVLEAFLTGSIPPRARARTGLSADESRTLVLLERQGEI